MINKFFRRLAKPARSRQFNRTLNTGIAHLNGGRLDQALGLLRRANQNCTG